MRTARPDDLPFIFATWLNSYHSDSAIARSVRKSVFFNEYRRIIDKILLDAAVKIACLPTDENVILGYLVFEPYCLHYCFVKEAFRFSGIAKDLVNNSVRDACKYYTHHTKALDPIVEKYSLLTYNPFLLYETFREEE